MSSIGKFFALLEHYPFLKPYWDAEKREVHRDALMRRMGTMSSGEVVIAKCVLTIWNYHDGEPINIADLASVSANYRRPIVDWLASPFWP